MYDLDNTGSIEKHEVARLLAALSADNPGIHLSEPDIESLVEQVASCTPCLYDGISDCVYQWIKAVGHATCM